MIQKYTKLNPIDKCGVWVVNTFHLYKGSNRKKSFYGDFVKVSVRKTKPNNWITNGSKLKAILNLTKKEIKKNDGCYFKVKFNSCILLKKRLTPKGKELFGPSTFLIKRKKFINSFIGIL